MSLSIYYGYTEGLALDTSHQPYLVPLGAALIGNVHGMHIQVPESRETLQDERVYERISVDSV